MSLFSIVSFLFLWKSIPPPYFNERRCSDMATFDISPKARAWIDEYDKYLAEHYVERCKPLPHYDEVKIQAVIDLIDSEIAKSEKAKLEEYKYGWEHFDWDGSYPQHHSQLYPDEVLSAPWNKADKVSRKQMHMNDERFKNGYFKMYENVKNMR